jgi:hypothetical protein
VRPIVGSRRRNSDLGGNKLPPKGGLLHVDDTEVNTLQKAGEGQACKAGGIYLYSLWEDGFSTCLKFESAL